MRLPPLSYNVRRFRHALGWSQGALAQRAGFQQQYISAIERGAQVRRAGDIAALAAAFGVSDRQLLRQPRLPKWQAGRRAESAVLA